MIERLLLLVKKKKTEVSNVRIFQMRYLMSIADHLQFVREFHFFDIYSCMYETYLIHTRRTDIFSQNITEKDARKCEIVIGDLR